MELLELQSPPRSESSDSITLAALIDTCKSYNMSIIADALNVWHERLPDVECEEIRAKYKAVKHETKTEAEPKAWERFQALVLSLQNTHEIVLLWFPRESEGGCWAFCIVMRAAAISQLMLPDIGHEICKAVQAQQADIPGIIGGRTREVVNEALLAIESAARDYVNMPARSQEAAAGTGRGLMRRQEMTTSIATCTFGECEIDFAKMTARRAGKPVAVTTLELKLLRYFMNNAERVLSRDELLDEVWGYNCYPTTRSVDNLILKLRRKLEPNPTEPRYLQTVYGAGYRFVP